MVAFANHGGGNLVIGVTDEGVAKGLKEKEVDGVQNYFVDYVRNKVKPRISFSCEMIKTEENTFVLCFGIPEYKGDVVRLIDTNTKRERMFVREPGSTRELLTIDEITEFSNRKTRHSYNLQPTEYLYKDYTFNALNEKYYEKTEIKDPLNDKQFRSLNLINDDGHLTIAGMLFADQCERGMPLIQLRKWLEFDMGSDRVLDAKEYRANLIEQLEVSEKFIRNYTKTGLLKQPFGAKAMNSYNMIAVTEILVNAIVHRDYTKYTAIEIQQSSNATYRLFDFKRKDKFGNERELHVEKGLKAILLWRSRPHWMWE